MTRTPYRLQCPLCRQPWSTHSRKCAPMLELERAGRGSEVAELMRRQAITVALKNPQPRTSLWAIPLTFLLLPAVALIRLVDWFRYLGGPRRDDTSPWGSA